MKTHTVRFAGFALVLVSLAPVLSLATILYALTRQPTTLTGMLAVRWPLSGCHTPAPAAWTGTLQLTLRSDQHGQIGLQVEHGEETSPIPAEAQGDPPLIITAHPVTVVDTSAIVHQSVDPYRFGMMVARVNVPC